jgi:endoglucanase
MANMLHKKKFNEQKNLFIIGIAIVTFLLTPAISKAQEIYVNQLGYYPWAKKYAVIENPISSSTHAEVIDAITGKTILKINLPTPKFDRLSLAQTTTADFSTIKQPGTYNIRYHDKLSYDFEIKADLYSNALELALRTFYLQSCGKTVLYKPGEILHAPCHLKDGYIKRSDKINPAESKIDAVGGWHDAGDYGKYVASTTTAIYLLLSLYEINPSISDIDMYDSNNKYPDILEETKYALDWMLKMQREDGGVYRKCSGETWPSDTTLSRDDTQRRYIYGVSTQDTGRFAAAMAKAAKVYWEYDKTLSNKYLNASKKAWAFMLNNPNFLDYERSDDSGSGGYPNPDYDTEKYAYTDKDEIVWAAAELYITTKDSQYLDYVRNNINEIEYESFSWKNTAVAAVIDLATQDVCDIYLKDKMKKQLTSYADEIVNKMETNPYAVPIEEFRWASNVAILNEGITLAYAYKATKTDKYRDYALKTINYVFGVNPLNKSFITGLGDNPPLHIHHRYMMATGKVLPGFMVGGPNNTANDNIATPGLGIKSYIDNQKSYATNEYAIDYNASLVFMLGWAQSLR